MQTRFFANSAVSRLVLMGLMVASLLLWLPATLASAQTGGDDVQYNAVCQSIIGAIGDITQTQDASATAVDVDTPDAPVVPPAEEAAEGSEAEADAQAEAEAVEDEAVEDAVADRGVVAEVAQEQGVSIEQVNECLNGAAGTGGDDTGDDTADTTSREADVLASTIPDQKVLANTGGPALLLPALGLLLISSVALRNLLRR